MAILATHNLVKKYSKRTVVDHVSINVEQGEIVGLLGPNGAGKTTTFYMMVGLIKANEGRITLDDEDITSLPMYRRARRGIGYLSQEPSTYRKLTVAENVASVLEFMDLSSDQTFSFPKRKSLIKKKRRGISSDERKQRQEKLLNDLGIAHLAKHKAYTLSGGERRRVEIARVLASEPSFILLDEPFTGIDPKAVKDIQKIILQLHNLGLGVFVTDHSAIDTLEIVDRAYLISDGKIELSGTPEELVKSELARKLYFGDEFQSRFYRRET
ncbi:LPS export ABC transporter ATP-binding protein [Candidatus Poribacteria bacterium]|nr:LPS export ABC transporter ATP-binding protein [Candidatus Poribacteria bacterium]